MSLPPPGRLNGRPGAKSAVLLVGARLRTHGSSPAEQQKGLSRSIYHNSSSMSSYLEPRGPQAFSSAGEFGWMRHQPTKSPKQVRQKHYTCSN